MTLTLNLPPEIEQRLLTRAQSRGMALAAFAQEVLAREAEPAPPPQVSTVLDLADVAGTGGVERGAGRSRLLDVCAMVRGLTDDADFSRNPSTGRPVDLS